MSTSCRLKKPFNIPHSWGIVQNVNTALTKGWQADLQNMLYNSKLLKKPYR